MPGSAAVESWGEERVKRLRSYGGGMNKDLAASYRCAEEVARRCAGNFYYAFVVLPSEKRRAFCAVYAFMRHCDDISDGLDSPDERRRVLGLMRSRMNAALRGEFDGTPIFPAFCDSVRQYSIPPDYFHWILDGVEMDLTIDRYQTFDDLYRYCFHVASAVGLVCLQIFGYSGENAKKLAEQCGIAFQLTNILRDLKEDAAMGRIYLPAEDLDRFRYTADELRQGVVDVRFRDLMAFEAKRAAHYYRQARDLLPLVDNASRPALWAMMEIYGRLLKKIERFPVSVFDCRIRLSRAEKASIALTALAMRFLRV